MFAAFFASRAGPQFPFGEFTQEAAQAHIDITYILSAFVGTGGEKGEPQA